MDEQGLIEIAERRVGFVESVRPQVAHTGGYRANRNGTTLGRAESPYALAPERALPMTRASWHAKRVFDILIALGGLLLLSPVLLVAAVGVRVSSRGPIVFRQPRVGRGGRIFTMYKFRTYPVDHVDDKFSREHDECPLPWGRLLRRTSIDELPQLFNVLRGDMSLVGPRPERPHFVGPLSKEVPEYTDRHRVPGGITGAAQVQGLWGNTSIEDRIRIDNRYIEHWSFRRDLGILARTPIAMLRKGRLPECDENSASR